MDLMLPRLNFIGEYDSSRDYNYLDCCIREGSVWVFDGTGHWTEISPVDIPTHEKIEEEEEVFFRCVSCGAPTLADGSCPYCGTINRKVRKFNVR